jgi:drug/metabolite transporter (DMT)-like permease
LDHPDADSGGWDRSTRRPSCIAAVRVPPRGRAWLGGRAARTKNPVVKPLLGISCKILSALAFTLMSAGLKSFSDLYPVGELVFFRSAFALVPLLVWLKWRGDLVQAVRTSHVSGHFVRGLIGSVSMFSSFVALSFLPLSEAIAIGYAAPLITVVLAAVILKETVRSYRWTAVGIGFVGVLIMLSPHLGSGAARWLEGGPTLGALFALFGACCSAGATIQVRRLTATEKTGAIVFYFSILTTALGLATIVIGWRMPTLSEFTVLVLVGILGGIGQILLTQSFRFADASVVAPFEYTTMVWALVVGWFLFGDLPTSTVVAGACIVATAGLLVFWRERQLGLARAEALETASRCPSSG